MRSMIIQNHRFCFCTLALGKKYCALASLLASDLQQYTPGTALVVLTDDPSSFTKHLNVIAVPHQQQSIGCYHDKRFVIQAAIDRFDSCIFIDADMRVLGDVSPDLNWLPGITARSGCGILKHNQNRSKVLSLLTKVAEKWNLELATVQYINEFLFTVSRNAGKELAFLRYWDEIAPYFELHGIYAGEGNAIGLAAAKAGLAIQFDRVDRFPFFKDRIERIRISTGEAAPTEKLAYFDEQQRYEYPDRSRWEKLLTRLSKRAKKLYRILHLRAATLKKFNFYYR